MGSIFAERIYSERWERAVVTGHVEAVVLGCGDLEAVFPELVEASAGMDAAEGEDVLGTGFRPEHPRLFAPGTDHGLAAGLHDAGADEVADLPERAVLHALHVGGEVVQGSLDRHFIGFSRALAADFLDQVLDLVLEQPLGPAAKTGPVLRVVLADEGLDHPPGVLHRVEEIDDLDAVWKGERGHIAQADRPADEHDDLPGASIASAEGLLAQQGAEVVHGLACGNVPRRFPVANRPSLLIGSVLVNTPPR